MIREALDVTSLALRAGENHLRYFAPAVRDMDPPHYAGKVESTCATVALDVLGVEMKRSKNPAALARLITGASLQIRAYDEVIDDVKPYTDEPITHDDLNNTPVFHKFAGASGRNVTGQEGIDVALTAMDELIPGNGLGSKRRKHAIEEALATTPELVVKTVNNPAYQQGEVLPYPTTLQLQTDMVGFLGEATLTFLAAAMDVPQTEQDVELLRRLFISMQFGDNILDWRKDWREYRDKQAQTERPLRPQENLFRATLDESRDETEACAKVLDDTNVRSAVWARRLAPASLAVFRGRFDATLDHLPRHQYAERGRGMASFMFYKGLPLAPETGRFHAWAKY